MLNDANPAAEAFVLPTTTLVSTHIAAAVCPSGQSGFGGSVVVSRASADCTSLSRGFCLMSFVSSESCAGVHAMPALGPQNCVAWRLIPYVPPLGLTTALILSRCTPSTVQVDVPSAKLAAMHMYPGPPSGEKRDGMWTKYDCGPKCCWYVTSLNFD